MTAAMVVPSKSKSASHRAKAITLDELSLHFHQPINEVSKKLGVCVTVLKQRCREHGIARWPYRKVRKLDNIIRALQSSCHSDSTRPAGSVAADEREQKISTMKETRDFLLMNPSAAATLGKLNSNTLPPQLQHNMGCVPSSMSEVTSAISRPVPPSVDNSRGNIDGLLAEYSRGNNGFCVGESKLALERSSLTMSQPLQQPMSPLEYPSTLRDLQILNELRHQQEQGSNNGKATRAPTGGSSEEEDDDEEEQCQPAEQDLLGQFEQRDMESRHGGVSASDALQDGPELGYRSLGGAAVNLNHNNHGSSAFRPILRAANGSGTSSSGSGFSLPAPSWALGLAVSSHQLSHGEQVYPPNTANVSKQRGQRYEQRLVPSLLPSSDRNISPMGSGGDSCSSTMAAAPGVNTGHQQRVENAPTSNVYRPTARGGLYITPDLLSLGFRL